MNFFIYLNLFVAGAAGVLFIFYLIKSATDSWSPLTWLGLAFMWLVVCGLNLGVALWNMGVFG